MKKSNASKLELEDGVDRISSLPDPILHLILSRIPTTEEVFRTCILSKQWRYLWTSVPSIDIDYTRGLKPFKEFKRSKFKEFVYWVLLNKPLDLDSFRLWCSDYYNMSTIRQWIHVAVVRKVKILDLMFCPRDESEDIQVPHFLVTCGSLQVLRLILHKRCLILPEFTGFPALRVLELKKVDLSYKHCLVNKFLKSCPLLEDLSLIDCMIGKLKVLCISCPKLKSLRIDNRNIIDPEDYDLDNLCGCIEIVCPKLVYFEFGAFVAQKYIFKSLGLLKKAVIHPEDFPTLFVGHAMCLAGLSHLESLSTSIDVLCYCLCPPGVHSSLPNLKTLTLTPEINYHNPGPSKLIRVLACLLHLESLHLIIQQYSISWKDWKLDEAETRNISILTCHLKRVEFLKFNEQKPVLDMARFFLEHGNALEEMVFRWNLFDESRFHERSMETMKELSNFHKASATVKLLFFNETSYYQLSGKP